MKSLCALLAAAAFGLMLHFAVQAMFEVRYLGEALNYSDLLAIFYGCLGAVLATASDEAPAW